MKNLASHDESAENVERISAIVHKELIKAGITPVLNNPKERGEVPSRYDGVYESFTFKRAWYYWMVGGYVPLAVAEEMFNDPNGKEDIRVCGHCGCPPPSEWTIKVDDSTGKIITADKDYTTGEGWEANGLFKDYTNRYIPQSKAGTYKEYIPNYHIDTQEGLNFFIQTLKKHGVTGKKA